ncbi:hypothetical protein K493DRAFT_310163 [Basidiobolus meristosporus CBS 931.73]|uniref:Uncharacterized protein n=1 Tax=Basidiobolus meristosporus CBS 931.73 TaxID=1314790 RepID=A0A1Y1ZBX7_9FUNG|nr:hypothetical protein K493DRAFT_310163 [Basidiobolus meristosporus CBS 931.73]|eukprot:ORY07624.1 hypothetical protein K493DRAFT_310163 [Basidiobolus meristosporus CBS 931.73]
MAMAHEGHDHGATNTTVPSNSTSAAPTSEASLPYNGQFIALAVMFSLVTMFQRFFE